MATQPSSDMIFHWYTTVSPWKSSTIFYSLEMRLKQLTMSFEKSHEFLGRSHGMIHICEKHQWEDWKKCGVKNLRSPHHHPSPPTHSSPYHPFSQPFCSALYKAELPRSFPWRLSILHSGRFEKISDLFLIANISLDYIYIIPIYCSSNCSCGANWILKLWLSASKMHQLFIFSRPNRKKWPNSTGSRTLRRRGDGHWPTHPPSVAFQGRRGISPEFFGAPNLQILKWKKNNDWLLVEPFPSEKYESAGMMIIPYMMERYGKS